MTTRDGDQNTVGVGGREYGVGRVPADVDPINEALAQMDAAQMMAGRRATRPAVELGRCDHCGQELPRSLLMHASIGVACPTCYDESEVE